MSPPSASPAISVIIATCGRVALALDAVASVFADGFAGFEIVVVDQGASRELESRLVAAHPSEPRLHYVHLDRACLSLARNVGVERSRGEIIHFLDDDAVLVPGSLSAYLEAFASTGPRAPGIVAGRLQALWERPRPGWLPADKEYLLGIYDRDGSLRQLAAPDLPVGANFAARRSVVLEVGPFDERLGFSYSRAESGIGGEDSLLSLRARRAGYPILYQPAAMARHRISAAKLRRTAFLRRNYWEGVTAVVLAHLSDGLAPQDARALARRQRRGIVRDLLRLLEWRHGRLRLLSSRERMELLASCAHRLGTVRASRRLLASGSVP